MWEFDIGARVQRICVVRAGECGSEWLDGGHEGQVRGFVGTCERGWRGMFRGYRRKSRCVLDVLEGMIELDREVWRDRLDIVGYVYFLMNLMRFVTMSRPTSQLLAMRRETLKKRSITNSLIALPQLPGQMGCFSSSNPSSSSSVMATAVVGPKLTRRNVPSSIPKSHEMMVSQHTTDFWINVSSDVGDCVIQDSRTCVIVIQSG